MYIDLKSMQDNPWIIIILYAIYIFDKKKLFNNFLQYVVMKYCKDIKFENRD